MTAGAPEHGGRPVWLGYAVGGLLGLALAWLALRLGPVLVVPLAVALLLLARQLGAAPALRLAGQPKPRRLPKPQPALAPIPLDEDEPKPLAAVPEPQPPPAAGARDAAAAEPLDMVALPGGHFWMGSDKALDPGAYDDELPRHRVWLDPFLIARTPVTRGLWRRVMADRRAGDWRRPEPKAWRGNDEALPANHVSWRDAVAFCNALSVVAGRRPFYRADGDDWIPDPDPAAAKGYRLPTEAEWEYACRGDTKTPWFWGDQADGTDAHAWYGDYRQGVQPVAGKAPNPFGLYDMAGNCWEWCWDRYGPYSAEQAENPMGSDSGRPRVLRGGSFVVAPWVLRSARRHWADPEFRHQFIGFRCARSVRRSSTT